jgi:urease accessory protein
MQATAAVTAELVAGRVALTRMRSDPPVAIRATGPAQVHVVGTAAGPLAGDVVQLDLVVRAGAELTVRTSAATVALRGAAGLGRPSQFQVRAVVEQGAQLCFWPEPTVAAAGCDHVSRVLVDLAGDAHLTLREQLVGGRSCDQSSGRLRCELRVDRAGEPLLHQTLTLGPDATYGADQLVQRCVGSLLVVDPREAGWDAGVMDFPAPETVVCALAAHGGWLATALSEDAAQLRSALNAAHDHLRPLRRSGQAVPAD